MQRILSRLLLLLKNKCWFDFKEFKLQFLSHSFYPSLHVMTSVLEHFGVENRGLEVSTDMKILKQLPASLLCIAHNHNLVLVEKLGSDRFKAAIDDVYANDGELRTWLAKRGEIKNHLFRDVLNNQE